MELQRGLLVHAVTQFDDRLFFVLERAAAVVA
jgi:hypothetical protein